MADDDRHDERRVSRREILKRAGRVSAAAAVQAGLNTHLHGAEIARTVAGPAIAQVPAAAIAREPLVTLTAAESDALEAICARLIPTDANGPGATEARAARYIDRALVGALSSARQAYVDGLAALDRYASSARGAPFAKLSPADQDAVLTDLESGKAPGFNGSSTTFFNLLRAHTIQGTFCDPYYGGNANFVGWDLIGYPGVRTIVTADQQRMGIETKPNHKSAYDYDMFTKASARVGLKPDATSEVGSAPKSYGEVDLGD